MEPMYHIRTTDQNVAPYVLLPGDPHRVPLVAAKWDTAEKIADNREHVTYTGTYKGMARRLLCVWGLGQRFSLRLMSVTC